jgi:hypothetical protein
MKSFKFLVLIVLITSQNIYSQSDKVPDDLKMKILMGYKLDSLSRQNNSNKNNKIFEDVMAVGIFKRKPKLREVKEPTTNDTIKLPDWISNKKYVTDNVDALKYEPTLLVGGLVKTSEDGSFDVYTVTWNISDTKVSPELSQIEKPTNFYEQTFDSSTRFNSDFLIGGASVALDEVVKITYTETNYVNLVKYDTEKLENLRKYILTIPGADLNDWAIIRGVVILDCTNSKSVKMEADTNVSASWISASGSFYQQEGNTNNFRLISIDLENLFLTN